MKITTISMMVMLALTMVTAAAATGNENEIIFVLGTDVNKNALQKASLNDTIASELNITIFSMNDSIPQNFDFSNYPVIFVESQNETMIAQWSANIISAREKGRAVIGYNLSSANATLPNIDLRSSNYTDIERYWVQGGNSNMENMLKFMGQKFCNAWANESIPDPELLHPKINITFILNYETDNFFLNKVISERSVIMDRFNVTVMDGEGAASNLTDVSDEDVIMLGMIGANEFPEFKDALLAANVNGTQIGLIGNLEDTYGVSNIDMNNNMMKDYHENGGYTNMENWIRCIGATLKDAYIEYSPAVPPSIPDHGIYHPDAFPMIFEDSREYLEWYTDHGYNASAPTIGIITNKLAKDKIYYATDNAIIRDLESKGCNVIYTTNEVCS
ncbi:MAG: cobaltochelatase subunit CobN, partial [ANME-2 cluster archaeon]|nr:cobaltochelatase subunit CobN [ANME-2 cluster archaeon]